MTKEERKVYMKQYRLDNKEYWDNYNKSYYQSNKDQIKEYYQNNIDQKREDSRQHYKNNKEQYQKRNIQNLDKNRLYWKEYGKRRKQTDPNYKLICTIRDRTNNAIVKGYKKSSSKELLGCSIDECREYIESMFMKEMSWSNHGEIWELDHIQPVSSFDLTNIEEQYKCFNYTNLQPLFKNTYIAEGFGYKNYIGNREKGDKRTM